MSIRGNFWKIWSAARNRDELHVFVLLFRVVCFMLLMGFSWFFGVPGIPSSRTRKTLIRFLQTSRDGQLLDPFVDYGII